MMPDLLERPNALAQLVESVIQQVLEAQVTDHLSADRYERTDDRGGYRNGYRERQIYTRVGPLTLRVPQTRDGSFSSDIFSRYRRSEQAFVLGLMEMVVNGVSTRKVSEITETLCGTSFSKSTVSRLAMNLDGRVNAFLSRRLDDIYPFIVVDALFTKSRCDDRVMSKAVLIVGGIRNDGYRDILGVSVGDAESAATWNELFAALKRRGLHGVDFVISDDHAGLVEAVSKQFAGATWQRCQVHLMLQHARTLPEPGTRRIGRSSKADFFLRRHSRSTPAPRRLHKTIFRKPLRRRWRALKTGLMTRWLSWYCRRNIDVDCEPRT